MKSIGKLIILLLMSIYIVSLLGFKQVEQEKQDRAVISKAAMLEFNSKYDNNWKIYWNNRLGVPSYIMGHKISKYSGTPEEIAEAFMNEEKVMLGIENVERDMEVTKTNYSEKGGTRLTYIQKYNGVAVLSSGYLVAVKDEEIYYVSGKYYPELDIDTNPSITNAELNGIIRYDLTGSDILHITEPEISIFVYDSDPNNITYILAYKVIAKAAAPIGPWQYIIDAKNGDIIMKTSLILYVNGSGNVYETNPTHGEPVEVTLHRLSSDYSPRKLIGENVKVYNDAGEEASSQSGSFMYDTTSTHFDEVMAYYHCDEFETWLITLGMENTKLDTVEAHVYQTYWYNYLALADQYECSIWLSDGVRFGKKDPAKEAAVITHEYMHLVSEEYHSLYPGTEPRAMDEAYSDYFSVAYKNDILSPGSCSYIGDWTYYPSYIRDLDLFRDYDDLDSTESPHYNSQILSGALWDFRTDNDVTPSEADEDVLESLNNLSPSTDFLDARNALITSANTNGHSYNVNDIENAFDDHLIIIIPPMTVEIDGPDYLYEIEHDEWYADVSGGESPYSYQWKALDPESEEPVWELIYWYETSTVELSVSDLNEEFDWNLGVDSEFYLKVIVTDDASESDSSQISIEIIEGGPQKKLSTKQLPKNFKLEQNYPNPFNPATTINFQLPKASNVTLVIYNIQGQEVARLVDGYVEAGYHSIPWKPGRAASGIYIYRLQAGIFSDTKRMLYIK